jgi:diketogulonate reductase-like aldo/keto reductase
VAGSEAVNEDAAAAVLARAFELGIRLVDTAPCTDSVSLTAGSRPRWLS